MEKEKKVCLRSRDIEFVLFLAEYGIITNENVRAFYDSEYYYKNRLASLAKGEIIERLYGKVILSRKGKAYLNKSGFGYRNINRDENYKKRMERISDIACKIKKAGWYFEPSWRCSVNVYTKRGNRFVGVMAREKRWWSEENNDFYKRAYIAYFIHKDITPRELKYIDKEIERSKSYFRGVIIFIEDEWLLNHPRFTYSGFSEVYTILYNKETFRILEKIKDKDYMKNKILKIFGNEYERLKTYIYEIYTLKQDGIYTYIVPMPFADFAKLEWINYMANSSDYRDVQIKVVCFENCIEEVRGVLDEKVEVVCIEVE